METPNLPAIRALRPAWNKGRIVGQKRPLKPKHVWAIRVRLELAENHRDLALFNMANPGRISKAGDHDVRATLYAAANAMMMRSVASSEIKSWGLRLMRRKGRRRAVVAVARKLAVIMHRM